MPPGKMESLRPQAGQPNTIYLNDGIRYVKLISKKFICPKCNIFCGELVPVLDGRTRARLRRLPGGIMGNLPRTRVFCYNGCHDHPAWGWKIFNWESQREIDSIKSWPEEWKRDKHALEAERKARNASERSKS